MDKGGICVRVYVCEERREQTRDGDREYETEARENSIAGVYTAFTDQVITRNASRSLFRSLSLSILWSAHCAKRLQHQSLTGAIRNTELRPTATQIAPARRKEEIVDGCTWPACRSRVVRIFSNVEKREQSEATRRRAAFKIIALEWIL